MIERVRVPRAMTLTVPRSGARHRRRPCPPSYRGLQAGDLIVGIVRRPDPVPCGSCAVGEWDMCRNGLFTERGVKELDGFMSERWRIEAGYLTEPDSSLGILGVLLEPTTAVAQAWEIVEAMRARAFWEPEQVLVTRAGPIGMLAALIGIQHGLDVHVLDQVTEGAKPQLVQDLAATYHAGPMTDIGFEPDVVIECTGVGSVDVDSIPKVGAGGVVGLTGVGSGGASSGVSPADMAKELVWRNNLIIGSVNANRGISTRRPERSSPPTGPGWRGSSGDRCRWRTSPTRCGAGPTTSRSSWTSEADDGRDPVRKRVEINPARAVHTNAELGSEVVREGGHCRWASCAARLRRLDEQAEILMVERGPHVSYANCGLP